MFQRLRPAFHVWPSFSCALCMQTSQCDIAAPVTSEFLRCLQGLTNTGSSTLARNAKERTSWKGAAIAESTHERMRDWAVWLSSQTNAKLTSFLGFITRDGRATMQSHFEGFGSPCFSPVEYQAWKSVRLAQQLIVASIG